MQNLRSSLTALVVAGVTAFTGHGALAYKTGGKDVYLPAHGMSVDLGQSRVIGYFVRNAKGCDVSLVIAEAIDGPSSGTPARVRFTLAPGAATRLAATATRQAEITCSADADMVSLQSVAY